MRKLWRELQQWWAAVVHRETLVSDGWLQEQRRESVRNQFDGICIKWPIVKDS